MTGSSAKFCKCIIVKYVTLKSRTVGKSASETRMWNPAQVDLSAMKLNKNNQMFSRRGSKGCGYLLNSAAVLMHLIVFASPTQW